MTTNSSFISYNVTTMNTAKSAKILSFRDIGRCIYCGDTSPPLTDEHVLPRGLGGNMPPRGMHEALVLKEASCKSCQEITKKIEQTVLRGMMDNARNILGVKGKEQRNKKVKAHLESFDGVIEEKEMDVTEIPVGIAIPAYQHATIFLGDAKRKSYMPGDVKVRIISNVPQTVMSQYKKVGESGIAMDPGSYAQMLAKIALGFAIAHYGPDGFTPLVHEFIRGDKEEYGHWVGPADTSDVSFTGDSFHSLSTRTVTSPNGPFLIIYIQLFAEFNCPIHYVVVGRPK